MFLFRAFDTYVVNVLGGHPKEKHRELKHHTTICFPQQALGNTSDFHVYLSMIVFGA
jgi:hypothetical protein